MPAGGSAQIRYAAKAYGYAGVTFVRRVVLGRDPYWRRYFWNRWARYPAGATSALRDGPVVWIDALSGGETTQAVTFCRLLRERLPDHRVVFSTNNRYSFDFASAHLPVDAVIDSPWDIGPPVRRALRSIGPSVLVAIESLTAPALFAEASARGIPTVLVSGLMSSDIHRHPALRRTMAWAPFGRLTSIGAKSARDRAGFIEMGARPEAVVVTGNMKFDAPFLHVPEERRRELRASLGLQPGERVLLAASLHPREEALVGRAFLAVRSACPGVRLVVVPRYGFDAGPMAATLEGMGLRTRRRSDAGRAGADEAIVVDTFGELSHLYAIAAAVFMGGTTYARNVVGLGQNMIEPLAQHCPIFFGPYASLWREITDELRQDYAGLQVATADELAGGLREVLGGGGLGARLAERARHIMARHAHDVGRNVDLVARIAAGAGGAARVASA